ncbi:MAG TPA: D-glycerate dehydrogenase, partial [Actinomycetota bacterium]|nr:D-glycerate dehydrogenase [Actinomycetota bacterium]
MPGAGADGRWPVLVTRRLPAPAMERVAERCDVALHEGPEAIPRDRLLRDIAGKLGAITLLTDRVDDEFLDAAGGQLVVTSNFAVGFDNVDVPACTARGVLVCNTPDVLTETTADLAWTLMMSAARRIAEGDRFLRRKVPWIWGPEFMLGQDIHHKTLGIVGFGRIGHAMARRAQGFGMRVIYYDVYRAAAELEQELNVEFVELEELLETADFVTLHTVLSEETRHLINAERLKRMKPTAVLVNTSRGPVIDESALADALEAGEIFAAGLDVFEKEPEVHPKLLELENVVIIPHLGSATVDTRIAMGLLAADNLIAA